MPRPTAIRRIPVFALAVSLPNLGCTVVIRPPVRPADPVAVYLIDYAYHSSLILPRDGGEFAEYGYGEWEWFAKNRTQWWRVPAVLFLPNRASLGRHAVAGPLSVDALRQRGGFEAVFEIRAARDLVRRLLDRLDARFTAGGVPIPNPASGMDHVSDAAPYWIWHNCNSVVVDWLRELGCRARGLAVNADFEVCAAGEPASESP